LTGDASVLPLTGKFDYWAHETVGVIVVVGVVVVVVVVTADGANVEGRWRGRKR
jgi:hypothetical protein